jgi:hypothetical protein
MWNADHIFRLSQYFDLCQSRQLMPAQQNCSPELLKDHVVRRLVP